ncbi:diacylglycerol/lipid kinase family protein [Streptacidiphilus griseoplanus]|uniref:diacylglycerol/lipid kinase family protein n=1 Tax=Peterkaempfera griseoplana TaxID=66896 RepID=UPI0006E4133E|nr:diacylglycerol kinase family protein [Peterkaempfera griseoplana]
MTRRPAAGRWDARLALAAGTAALLLPLVYAGLRSLVLVAAGLAGIAVAAAGVWWVLARTGAIRALALVPAVVAPIAVVALYAAYGLLWVAVVSVLLWALAGSSARAALARQTAPEEARERRGAPARRPFLIMNPRSGGGKVGAFGLVEKAEALGAQVLVLDPAHPQDVAELARRAVDDGADLLGVAGGDGTQAAVAEVAAARRVPFLVIPAGTRNHFAMDLGLDRQDPAAALEALTDGVDLEVDLGFAGERVFVNNASFGAYAAVVQSPAYRDDKARTTLRMLPEILTHQRGPHLVLRAGPAVVDAPQAVLVSNNPYRTGDPAGLGLRVRLDSGLLGVLAVKVDNAAQAAGMLRGAHSSGLSRLTARDVVVEAHSPTVPVGVDGEALTLPAPVRCRIAAGALRVRVPRNRPGVPRAKPALDWHRVRRLAGTAGRTARG